MKRLMILFFLLMGLVLAACGDKDNDNDNPPSNQNPPAAPVIPTQGTANNIVTLEQDGSTVGVHVGETLQLELAANVTTGFEWSLVEVDENILRQAGEPEYRGPGGDDPPEGAGGTSIWRFEGVAPGETILRLYYARPGEEGVEPNDIFAITVIVD